MSVDYTRVNWAEYPSTNTPVNAENLNKMDKGIADLVTEAGDVQTDINSIQSEINSIQSDITDIEGDISDINDRLSEKIELTGTSSDTYQTLLNRLATAIDASKVTDRAVIHVGTFVHVMAIDYGTNTWYFSGSFIGGSSPNAHSNLSVIWIKKNDDCIYQVLDNGVVINKSNSSASGISVCFRY